MTPEAEIIDVRADELHMGDVLAEGIEIIELHVQANGWIKVVSNLSDSLEPAARMVRVIRADPGRLGLRRTDAPGTHVYADVTTRDAGPIEWEMFGDLRVCNVADEQLRT